MALPNDSSEELDAPNSRFDRDIPEGEYDRLMDYPEEIDFYSLLALPRDPPPTDAQIRSAYHTLTLSFHPDKQPSELHDAARNHYARIRTAYDTLIDPKKRVVYDMLGEDGVRAEWGAGEGVGNPGEAEKQVGVKSMDPGQFRRWFLTRMKQQERKELEQMVQVKGSIQLKLDARSVFTRGPREPIMPIAKPTTFSLGLNLTTPLSFLNWFQESDRLRTEDEDEEGQDQRDNNMEAQDEDMELVIHAGVGGRLVPTAEEVTYAHPETGEEETQTIELPPTLQAGNISLGAAVQHTVNGMESKKASLNRLLFPVFGDSVIQLSGLVLPEPLIQMVVNKSVSLAKNTFPVNCAVQTAFSKSPFHYPPVLYVTMNRHLSAGSIVYGSWSSGALQWPRFVEKAFSAIIGIASRDENNLPMPGELSKFDLGFYSLPKRPDENDDTPAADEEDIPETADSKMPAKEDDPKETWGVHVQTSPVNLGLSLTYSRNVFRGKPETPKRSEWNLEGYYPNKETGGGRSVRLQISTSVNADLSLGWNITGTRRVGDFTRIGLAVGLEGQSGLIVSLVWRRLGQTLKLPVALCPLEYAGNVAPLAVIVPWVTYSLVEFGFTRPRERRRQRRLVSKQRKRLRKLVDKRKNESVEAANLMSKQVQSRQAKEAAKDGLVILSAEYGYVSSRSDRNSRDDGVDNGDEMVDVTIPVAALVDQSQLIIPSDVIKHDIPGFYDPALLLPKVLRVRYRFAGKEHAVEIDESEGLTCPMRSHMG